MHTGRAHAQSLMEDYAGSVVYVRTDTVVDVAAGPPAYDAHPTADIAIRWTACRTR
jgi:hypothetical protein